MGRTSTNESEFADVTVTTIIPYSEEFTPPEMLAEAIETVENQVDVDAKPLVVEDEELRGPAWARNVGLERADTRYVAFLDGDDLWSETKLRDQLRRMRETGAGMCLEGDTPHSAESFIRGVMRSEIFALTSTILVDTERTDARYHEDVERREDHLYMMEVASEAGVCFVPECFQARKYEEGFSKHVNRSRDQVDEFFGIAARRVPEVRRHHDEYFATALVGLGRAHHNDGAYWLALEQYADALRHETTLKAVGAIGLTILALLAEYPRRMLRRLTARGRRRGTDEGLDR
jgi:glycosyltransferase involved in cell wall biosynthesis